MHTTHSYIDSYICDARPMKARKAPLLLLSQVCHTWPSIGSREGNKQQNTHAPALGSICTMCTPLNNLLTAADVMLGQRKARKAPLLLLSQVCHTWPRRGSREGNKQQNAHTAATVSMHTMCTPLTIMLTAADVMLGQHKACKAPLLLLSQVCHTWPSRGSREGNEHSTDMLQH
jgi:hypothetical protein